MVPCLDVLVHSHAKPCTREAYAEGQDAQTGQGVRKQRHFQADVKEKREQPATTTTTRTVVHGHLSHPTCNQHAGTQDLEGAAWSFLRRGCTRRGYADRKPPGCVAPMDILTQSLTTPESAAGRGRRRQRWRLMPLGPIVYSLTAFLSAYEFASCVPSLVSLAALRTRTTARSGVGMSFVGEEMGCGLDCG